MVSALSSTLMVSGLTRYDAHCLIISSVSVLNNNKTFIISKTGEGYTMCSVNLFVCMTAEKVVD